MNLAPSAIDSVAFDATATPVVIDTNLALDLLVFSDPAAEPLRLALGTRTLRWLATAGMRDELARVLGYPQIACRLPAAGAGAVLAAYDALTQQVSAAPRLAEVPRCKDPDDQPFIDLAVAHRALLLSKDGAVLGLSPRLRPHGVRVASAWPPAAAG